jgi:hypothetical protein
MYEGDVPMKSYGTRHLTGLRLRLAVGLTLMALALLLGYSFGIAQGRSYEHVEQTIESAGSHGGGIVVLTGEARRAIVSEVE